MTVNFFTSTEVYSELGTGVSAALSLTGKEDGDKGIVLKVKYRFDVTFLLTKYFTSVGPGRDTDQLEYAWFLSCTVSLFLSLLPPSVFLCIFIMCFNAGKSPDSPIPEQRYRHL